MSRRAISQPGLIHYVLGAPGSGKTTIIPYLVSALPDWIVIDWDDLMDPVENLTGRPVRDDPASWEPYAMLMGKLAHMLHPHPIILLSGRTPDELDGWAAGDWTLLDCDDATRRSRLLARGEGEADIEDALHDAASYRQLGFVAIDATDMQPAAVAAALANRIGGHQAGIPG